MFANRFDAAGRLLADLRQREMDVDLVVAVAPGGIPVGHVVADALDRPLDTVVPERIYASDHQDTVIGAVTSDGCSWINTSLVTFLDLEWSVVEAAQRAACESVADRAIAYGEGWGRLDVTDRRVLLVDDGIATGAAVRVCLQRLAAGSPSRLVVAAPVGPPDAVGRLGTLADDVVVPDQPDTLQSVAQYYDEYPAITDEEATTVLAPSESDTVATSTTTASPSVYRPSVDSGQPSPPSQD